MRATYGLPRKNSYLWIPGLPFCLILASVGWLAGDAPHPLLAQVMMGGVALALGALFVFCSIEARRARLIIDGRRVTVISAFSHKEVDCAEVRKARWGGGCLKLFDGTTRVTVSFRHYVIPDRVSLIEHLRGQVPRNVQTGWPWFEDQYFRRLLEVDKPGPDRVLVNRRRLDRLIVPSIAMIVILGMGRTWWARDPRGLVGAVFFAVVLISIRSLHPRESYYARTMTAHFREQPEMKWMLTLFPLAVIGCVVWKVVGHAVPGAVFGWLAGGLIASQWALIASMFLRERRRKRRVEAGWRPTE